MVQRDPQHPSHPSHVDPASRKAAVVALAIALLASMGSSTGCSTKGPETPSPPAAMVDGRAIVLADVDERIRRDLFEEEFGSDAERLYSARRAKLDEMIDEQLLAEAAAEAGVSPEAYLEGALTELPPITDEEIQALFEANRDRLPAEATIEPFLPQLRAHIEGRRRESVLADLRSGRDIEISIARERVEVAATGPSIGPDDAPVTIIEFSDFQCPYCARTVKVIEALREAHPDTVRVVYRHLPLSFHGQARLAAIASVCADEQDRFWDYHDLLFGNQNALGRDDLIAHAAELGLDGTQFEACLDGPEAAAIVDTDLAAADELGATGTPTFFINGYKLTGARPLEQFEAIIEEELARNDR